MNTALEWKDKPVKYLRDKVVEQLKFNLANDHLEMEEFEQLVTIALSTQSKAELLSLTADLPAQNDTAFEAREQELAVYDDTQSIVSILSESKRSGIWAPSKQMRVLAALSESVLDFRDVRLRPGLTYISLDCYLGEVKIIVPPGVNVVANVRNILASVKNNSRGKMNPDLPTLVIEGRVILGELKIAVKE